MVIYHQIAAQVYFTDKEIKDSLKKLPENNTILILYEEFCKNPAKAYQEIIHKYGKNGVPIQKDYRGILSFTNTNTVRIPIKDFELLKQAYQYFQNRSA